MNKTLAFLLTFMLSTAANAAAITVLSGGASEPGL